jgi:uncharacterized protein (TIGR03118 family)
VRQEGDTMRTNRSFLCLITALLVGLGSQSASAQVTQFTQTDFVSNVSGPQQITDPNLVDPWGIAFSGMSPAWIANTGTGVATLYTGGAQSPPVITQPTLIVTIPGGPTGAVFNFANGTGDFKLGSNPAIFMFATRAGTIAGWNPAFGTTAVNGFTATNGASYTGLAIATMATSTTLLYAADFRNAAIDVIDRNFNRTTVPGNFTDPNLPKGYAPFNIQTLNGKLFVTYAPQDGSTGQGKGFVDVFNLDGSGGLPLGLVRLVSNGALDAPFGLAIAPTGFGKFGGVDLGGDLLVGNRGDGKINVYDPATGAFIETLTDTQGNPISNTLLTALAFGNGNSFSSNALLFTAGDGVFGEIVAASTPLPTPLPAALPLFATGLGALGLLGWRRKRKALAAKVCLRGNKRHSPTNAAA